MTKQDKGFRKRHWKHEAHRRLSHHKHVLSVKIANCAVKLRFISALYEHLIITDSLLYPWGKKALTFSLNLTRLIGTPR